MDMGNMCAKFQTNDNGNAMLQFFLSELFFYKTVEDPLVSPLWGKRGKKFLKDYLFTLLCAAELALSR